MGHEVSIAPDGPSALSMVQKSMPEVVFLDIGLPGMDGYEVARRLREAHGSGKFKLYALSGYGRSEDLLRSAQAGFDQHLAKPVEFDDIEALLASS
jgi:CheY-like chemotaxis protein